MSNNRHSTQSDFYSYEYRLARRRAPTSVACRAPGKGDFMKADRGARSFRRAIGRVRRFRSRWSRDAALNLAGCRTTAGYGCRR